MTLLRHARFSRQVRAPGHTIVSLILETGSNQPVCNRADRAFDLGICLTECTRQRGLLQILPEKRFTRMRYNGLAEPSGRSNGAFEISYPTTIYGEGGVYMAPLWPT